MAGSLLVGAAYDAAHAAAVEREERLERVEQAASEDARATVGQLLQVERDFAERRVAAGAELAELERTSGDAVLDAALAGTGKAKAQAIGAQIGKLRAELETIDSAIEAAREKRRQAIVGVFKTQAEALRAEAEPLIAEAEREEALTKELLDLVEARKGVRPEFPGPPSSRMGAGAIFPMSSGPIAFQVLPEQDLRERAADLEKRAQREEGRRAKANGMAEGDTGDEVLAQIFKDPLQIGPRIADVLKWAADTEAAERARRRRVEAAGGTTVDNYIPPDAPVRFRLSWNDSAITSEFGIQATGPTIDEKLKAQYQDRLVEERAAEADRARAWLEARGGDLRTAVARAEAAGGQEGIAARQYQQTLEEEGLADEPFEEVPEADPVEAIEAIPEVDEPVEAPA